MDGPLLRFLPVFLLGTASLSSAEPPSVDFDREVRPILAEHCLECHSLDKAKGGLALTTREEALKKLKSGHLGIVPGQPEVSEVVKRVKTASLEDRMPPEDRKPLAPTEVETLARWVAGGAVWPKHWAYRPLQSFPLPPVKNTGWPRSDIDRFVLARLEVEGIAPSPEAPRTTLIRRVHYDLLGLPPSPEEVHAFLKDASPQAYERMVDAALASSHYGERWGRHWLDMARYADSDGYEKDRPRPDAWRYRDWVIRAINADMPFDEFTIEQLAGDLLPGASAEQVLATAFHRQTLTNTEGGTDQEQFRVEAVFDRTETTGAVWMGLSVGCARCHSHKYDQISHEEYFQLFAFFNNGDEATRQVATSPEAWTQYEKVHGVEAAKLAALQDRLDEAKAALKAKIPAWEKEVQTRLAEARAAGAAASYQPLPATGVASQGKTTFKKLDDGSWLAEGGQAKNDLYTVTVEGWTGPLASLQLEVLPHDSLPGGGPGRAGKGNFVLSEFTVLAGDSVEKAVPVRLHSPKADFEQKGYGAKAALDGDRESGWGVQPQFGKAHTLTVQLDQPVAPAPGRKLFIRMDQAYKGGNHNIGRFRLLGSTVVTEESIAPAEAVRVLNEEPLRRNDVVIRPLLDWLEQVDPEVAAAAMALQTAQQRLPRPPVMDVRVLAQRTREPRVTRVLHRGDFLSPAGPVKPAALAVLPPLAPRQGAEADRLDFARWLVSRQNPLTPRVTVNHFWARLFGEGLVRTVNDFGVRGDRPSHPELLDWLAGEFMNQGWSRKKMLKTIMMSATYRQSSAHRPELLEVDPQNKLLHRQNRLRVEGEVVRDLYLSASGLLSRKIGGASVFPVMPPDIASLSYANNFKWATSAGEDGYRRGMYTFFKRTAPHPDLTVFDCPDANTTNVRRTVSNTPLQALTTLNAAAFADAAKALARRLLEEKLPDDDARISRAFKLCLSRMPDEGEIKTLRTLLYETRAWYAAHPEEGGVLVKGFETPAAGADELAAWTATARIVLNVDEFITRE